MAKLELASSSDDSRYAVVIRAAVNRVVMPVSRQPGNERIHGVGK